MAALDTTSFAAALKYLYTDQKVAQIAYAQGPFFGIIPKKGDFTGKKYPLPIQYGQTQGRSVVFATALANKTSGSYGEFDLERVRDYAIASLDGEVLLASQGNAGALLDATKAQIDSALKVAAQSLANALYRDGSGYRGTVGVYAAGPPIVLTLTNADDIVNFEVGMKVQDYDNVGTTANVTAVDRDAGTITVDAGVWTVGGVTDYIIQHGDKDGMIKGLGAWIPAAAPGATLFFGVNRSVDTTRLGGIRYATGATIEERLLRGAARVAREGGTPDIVLMNTMDYSVLELALGTKVQYDVAKSSDGLIGFSAIKLSTPKGFIKVVPDARCPSGVAYMLQLDTWCLRSLGPAPRILDLDGNKFLREYNGDAYEIRCGYYAQLGCNAPGYNARIALP